MTRVPSGEQFEIVLGEQRATIVEVGGGLREYTVAGEPVLQPYEAGEMCDGAHGAVLLPWPNRLAEGRYEFDGEHHQLALTEPANGNAIHGLLRWRSWWAAEREPHRVVMATRLHPEPGYPFALDATVTYELGEDGLQVTIGAVNVGYVHSPATKEAEAKRVKETGKEIEKQNNRRAVDITVRELDIVHSDFAYTDQTSNPNYKLFINDTDLTLKNLSNHQNHGAADLTLRGKFMGSGDTNVAGDFLASQQGPAFDLKVALQNTDLTSLNDLLRAYGSFDVAAGQLSVFSQVAVKDGNMDGYIKPMFANLKVYDYQKDKDTGLLHQAKELAIGGASHLFKNRNTEKVAADIDLKGKLTSPDVDTWQAIGQVLRNAFIEAIIPGFDRAAASNTDAETVKQAQAH